jgi:hypothetical protein
VLLGLFCELKSDESGLGGNFLLVAKTPSFLPQPNSSTSHLKALDSLKFRTDTEILTETTGQKLQDVALHVQHSS